VCRRRPALRPRRPNGGSLPSSRRAPGWVGGWVGSLGARPCSAFGAVLLAPRAGPSGFGSPALALALCPGFWGLPPRSGLRGAAPPGGWVGGCGCCCPPSLARFARPPSLSPHQGFGRGRHRGESGTKAPHRGPDQGRRGTARGRRRTPRKGRAGERTGGRGAGRLARGQGLVDVNLRGN
jgi:hypothetical protein